MAIITTETGPVFDLAQICRGYFVRAKHRTWDETRNGLCFKADKNRLVVQYFPPVHSTTCYFYITAEEIEAGEWDELKVSADLETITDGVT